MIGFRGKEWRGGRARLPTPPLLPFATSDSQGRHSSASAELWRPPEPGRVTRHNVGEPPRLA